MRPGVLRGRATVGALLTPSMHRLLPHWLGRLDHVAVVPDTTWIDRGRGSSPRFASIPQLVRMVEQAARERPVTLHGIGLSICTAELFDEGYACNLIDWAIRLGAPWISEHLAFSRIGTGHETNAALLLPIPYDHELLELLIPRVRFFIDRVDRPFLLENGVHYVRYLDQDLTEEAFLNELCYRSGCCLLLDLHNLHTNAVNHGFNAADYLRALDLTRVVEVHIAGGVEMMGFHTDSHTGAVIDPVWRLLEQVIPLAPQLSGVTFEFHESSYARLGEDGICAQIERARSIVAQCCVEKKGCDVAAVVPASAC